MNAYKKAVMEYFKAKGIKYDDVDDRLEVTYNGDNVSQITTSIIFSDESGVVSFCIWGIEKVPEQNVESVIRACNTVNGKYKYVKFYVDEDRYFCARIDAALSMSNAGSACHEYVRAMVKITDKAYPILQKAYWE